MVFNLYIDIGDITSSIFEVGQHLKIIFDQDMYL